MKKLLCLLIVLILAFGTTACSLLPKIGGKGGSVESVMAEFTALLNKNSVIDEDVKLLNDFLGTLASSQVCLSGTIREVKTDYNYFVLDVSGVEVDIWVDSVSGVKIGGKVTVIGALYLESGNYRDVSFSVNGKIINESQIPEAAKISSKPQNNVSSIMSWFINNLPTLYIINDVKAFNEFAYALMNADIRVSGKITEEIDEYFFRLSSGDLEINVFMDEANMVRLGDSVKLSGRLLSVRPSSSWSASFSLTDCVKVR